MEQLKYYLNDFIAYRKERFPLMIYCPFALYLTMASLIGAPLLNLSIVFINAAIIILLLFQFRLWDDLHSFQEDRMIHPQRILCKTSGINLYWWMLVILFLLCMGLIYYFSITIISVFSYLLLMLLYMTVYLFDDFHKGRIYIHLIIIKYVVIVLIVTLMHTDIIHIKNMYHPLISVFLVMGIYEVIHDKNKYRNKSMRLMAIMESMMLILLNVSVLVLNGSNTSFIIKLMNATIFFTGIVFLVSILYHVTNVKLLKYVPHGISFVQFLVILSHRGV